MVPSKLPYPKIPKSTKINFRRLKCYAETNASDVVDYSKVVDLWDGHAQCVATDANLPVEGVVSYDAPRPATRSTWTFIDIAATGIIESLLEQGPSLGDFAEKIFVGLQTSADKVFILEERDGSYFSQELQVTVELEDIWLHPLLKGSVHMKRWVAADSERVILFPYEEVREGEFRLVPERNLKGNSPHTWDYLEKCREALSRRERGTFGGSEWYGYVYPKNLSLVSKPKILTPSLAQRGESCLDKVGDQFFVGSGGGGGGGYGILLRDPNMYEYLLGILNSDLLNWFVQKITTPFHSGWFAYYKAFISQIPIRLPESTTDVELATQIASSVRSIVDAKTRLRDAKLSDRERRSLEGSVESHERRIDEAVFRLYDVDGLPD